MMKVTAPRGRIDDEPERSVRFMKHLLYRWGIVFVVLLACVYILTPTAIDWSSGQLDGEPGTTEGIASHFLDISEEEQRIRGALRALGDHERIARDDNRLDRLHAEFSIPKTEEEIRDMLLTVADIEDVTIEYEALETYQYVLQFGQQLSETDQTRIREIFEESHDLEAFGLVDGHSDRIEVELSEPFSRLALSGALAEAGFANVEFSMADEDALFHYLVIFDNLYLPDLDWAGIQPLTLGLDLRGGLLLQYHVYVDRAVQDRLERTADDLYDRIRDSAGRDVDVDITHERGDLHIDIQFANSDDMGYVDSDFLLDYQNFDSSDVGRNTIRLEMQQDYIDETQDFAIEQAIETIRSRVDALGVAEPSVTRQGAEDIVVQLPGIGEDDVDRARDLIGQTAQLRFQMVADTDEINQYFGQFQGQLPEGFALRNVGGDFSITHRDKDELTDFFDERGTPDDRIIGYQFHPVYINEEEGIIDEERSYWFSFLLHREVEVTGDYIQDARVAIDPDFHQPYVQLNFDSAGADMFAETTTHNVGERFAIMMDDEVQSAPVINEPITGGRARITLGQGQSYTEMQQEAHNLVIVLRHGALPAPIELQFETLVGPTLGQESIDSSILALIVGSILVILFMLVYYKRSGFISTMALTMNLIIISAALALLGAVLTLPGIAGIILTVGMAVDANVIIYERIREEWVKGKPFRESINEGFAKAYSAVFDANITTGIAGLVLFQYGTGPIKGFAVTLLIGIIATLFTAVYVTRLFFLEWMDRSKNENLSI